MLNERFGVRCISNYHSEREKTNLQLSDAYVQA